MSKRGFIVTFVILFFLSAVWMGCSLLRWAGDTPETVDRRMMDSFESSIELCKDLSPEARQIVATFHTKYQAVLVNAAGEIIAETQEFLLLRENGAKIFLLPNLTDGERSQLRQLATKDEDEARQRLALASAFDYEGYIYGDVVYPYARFGLQDAVSVQKPLALKVENEVADDVLSGGLDLDGEQSGGEAYGVSSWLPYLREEPVETERLMELLAGAEPTRNYFKWEHFQTAPVGAETLAVYTVTHPLWDVFSNSLGTLAIWFLCTAVGSAFCSLALDWLLKKRKQ